ncbi:MAG: sodium:solute symporter [Fluviicola sp.]
MTTTLIITVIVVYFLVLMGISYLTSRKATNDSFFLGERKSPWYLVSFGMIGASLSGVTFLSVPGSVAGAQFSYMQIVFGYFLGYLVVAFVLLPLYYRLNLTSIYEYLNQRFGFWSYKTGAGLFLVSRIIGASIRLLLVAMVLQEVLFKSWGVDFEFTVIISVALIWLYTNRGGIKTIVWTDTLQTAFMLGSVALTLWFLSNETDIIQTKGAVSAVAESGYSQIFFFDDFMASNHFIKHILGGMFITIGMTGLDQDMMQKNLSCRSIKDAQKNMLSMAGVLVVVNLLFLALGAMLYMYAGENGVEAERTDLLFSAVAMDSGNAFIGVLFLLGLIAAAYSSADSALTSLTTSFSIDFLELQEKDRTQEQRESIRKIVHVGMSMVIVATVILMFYTTDKSAISLLLTLAGFTYGPLIGMFFFGILSKRSIPDKAIPVISLISFFSMFLMWWFSTGAPGVKEGEMGWLGPYVFGVEMILINALITFIGMMITSQFTASTKDEKHASL